MNASKEEVMPKPARLIEQPTAPVNRSVDHLGSPVQGPPPWIDTGEAVGPDATLLPRTTVPSLRAAKVGVVGGGLMGSGIAEVCARAGLDVVVIETSPAAVDAAAGRLHSSLDRAVRRGRLTTTERDRAVARVTISMGLAQLADRNLVIEAASEDEQVKLALFSELDAIVADRDALLASNTSSIPIMKLGAATHRPTQVIGMHFFNPVPTMNLVEIVPSLLTSEQTRSRAEDFVSQVLGKQSIACVDRAGFVANTLLVPYLLSAIRLLEYGLASREDIDTAMVQGCGHPMGPLQVTDLIGLDTTKAIADSLFAEHKEPLYAPSPLLARMVEAGLLGRKSGRGFYPYPSR
jgi:3-hydroxybutyryl-CoA dehydrogenase